MRKIWIAIILVLIVAIAVIALIMQPQGTLISTPTGNAGESHTPTPEQQEDRILIEKAIQEKNPEYCEKIQDSWGRESCIKYLE